MGTVLNLKGRHTYLAFDLKLGVHHVLL